MAYSVIRGKLIFSAAKSGPHGARRRGDYNRRITVSFEREGIERSYHATKGWRAKRVAA